MGSAESASTWDMWGGGTWADMAERSSLSKAQMRIGEAQRYIISAQGISPQIPDLADIELPHGHIMSDVVFDNIFTDAAQHDRIKRSAQEVAMARAKLAQVQRLQKERVDMAAAESDSAKEALDQARRQLQRIRAEVFERFAEAGAK
jgi:hypothetical protein